jgi:hypothetical protein
LDSEAVIASTFVKFGVRFSSATSPNPAIKTKEQFFVYAARNMFFDGRTAKAVSSWVSVHFDSLNQIILSDLVKKEDICTQATIASLLLMLEKHCPTLKNILNMDPLKVRLQPLGEFGSLGNKAFDKYNISAPGLSPDPQKYIKAA